MGLVAGNRVTTCTDESAKDGAVIGIEARMVPADDQLYVDIEKALTEKDVKEMVVPPGTPADVSVATKGERKAYVLAGEQASQKVVSVFHRSTRARQASTGPSPCRPRRPRAGGPRVWTGSSTRSRSLGPILTPL